MHDEPKEQTETTVTATDERTMANPPPVRPVRRIGQHEPFAVSLGLRDFRHYLTGARGIGGFEFTLAYDPARLKFQNARTELYAGEPQGMSLHVQPPDESRALAPDRCLVTLSGRWPQGRVSDPLELVSCEFLAPEVGRHRIEVVRARVLDFFGAPLPLRLYDPFDIEVVTQNEATGEQTPIIAAGLIVH